MTKIILYNTRTRTKEELKPIKQGEIGLYSCGPTVYWYQHIGNMRAYLFADTLKRVLSYNGFNIHHVMNYTDVGHLTSDADEGEDKMEKAAKKEGRSAQEIANHYASVFEQDSAKLNIPQADVVCKATEHIKEQIEMVKTLEEKGFTYKTSDGIYFDTSKFPDYPKFAKLNVEGLEEGKRIEAGEKKSKTDFALWKFSKPEENRQQEWSSPWGVGFPGWHIECSAMSSKYLGDHFDIHTGGIDHIPIHHTNEIAQSECCFGTSPWVNIWMHVAFLTSRGEKVSKSKGGLYTLAELEEKGFDPLDYRYFFLLTSYRKAQEFSLENLEAAKSAFDKLKNLLLTLKEEQTSKGEEKKTQYQQEFLEAINDDLNVSKALGILWTALRDADLGAQEKYALALDFDKIFGLDLDKIEVKTIAIPEEVKALADERLEARKSKDWKRADELRDQIAAKGFTINDTEAGYEITQ